jgi:hypothetical protein
MDAYGEDAANPAASRRPRHATRVDEAVAQDIQRRMAAMQVRRKCNQEDHQCTTPSTGSCEHPNHRRDADLLLSTDREFPGMLDMLGLDNAYPAYDAKEKATWLKWLGQAGPAENPDEIAA